ncbi:MAG: hypothetical protein EU530_01140 [Promethearchaeota archaeon]|nr:MAG: hypothetical protein EU530_01140 [Candidatus Lokiarchaeota archaeon]
MLKTPNPKKWRLFYPNKLHRETFLKCVEFRNPAWIPCYIHIFDAVWAKYRGNLKKLVKEHPFIFGTVGKFLKINYDHISDWHTPGIKTDSWGAKWKVTKGGYEGQVVYHPLADWKKLESFVFPDPLKFTEKGKRLGFGSKFAINVIKKLGILVPGNAERLFDRLYILRGFENLMRDIVKQDPHLAILIKRLTDHELTLIQKWLSVGADLVSFHSDIGTQDRLMISPQQFRTHIKPMFTTLFQTCRNGGSHVYFSSDGNLLEIVDDLIECGVSIHDPQYRANTIDGIAKHYQGKLCIDLDLDRQGFPFFSPEETKEHIATAVEKLYIPEGGLMMKAEISDPNVPLENIRAICEAYEEYCIF